MPNQHDGRRLRFQAELQEDTVQHIYDKYRDKHNVPDFIVDYLYLRKYKMIPISDIVEMIKQEYPQYGSKTEKQVKRTIEVQLKKPNVKAYFKDVMKEYKEEYDYLNGTLSVDERKIFLSKVIQGEIKEPPSSYHGCIFQKEADLKTKIQAINILNDYDIKLKQITMDNEFIINIVGEEVDMNRFKCQSKVENLTHNHKEVMGTQSDNKIKSNNLDQNNIEDVL